MYKAQCILKYALDPEIWSCLNSLLENIKKLFQNENENESEQKDLNNLFCSINTSIRDFHQEASKLLRPLESITRQAKIIENTLGKEGNLEKDDKQVIRNAVQMFQGILNKIEEIKYDGDSAQKMNEKINTLRDEATKRLQDVKLELEQMGWVKKHPFFSGAIASTSGAAVGAGIASALVISIESAALPCIGAAGVCTASGVGIIVGAAVGCAILLGAGVYLILKQYTKRTANKLKNNLKITEQLETIEKYYNKFKEHVEAISQKSDDLDTDIKDLEACVLDEVQRKANHDICKTIIEDNEKIIESIKSTLQLYDEFCKYYSK